MICTVPTVTYLMRYISVLCLLFLLIALEGSNLSFQEMKLVDALLHLLLKVPKGPVLPSACMGRAIART